MYSTERLINALVAEYEHLCHDDFDPDVDISPEDYRLLLKDLTYDELVEETCTDDEFTLDQYVEAWA